MVESQRPKPGEGLEVQKGIKDQLKEIRRELNVPIFKFVIVAGCVLTAIGAIAIRNELRDTNANIKAQTEAIGDLTQAIRDQTKSISEDMLRK